MHFRALSPHQITKPAAKSGPVTSAARAWLAGCGCYAAQSGKTRVAPALGAILIILAAYSPALSQTRLDITTLRHRIEQLESRIDAGAAGSGLYGREIATLSQLMADLEADLRQLNGRLAVVKQRLGNSSGRTVPQVSGTPLPPLELAPAGGPRRLIPPSTVERPVQAPSPRPGVRVLGPLPAQNRAPDLRASRVSPAAPAAPVAAAAPTPPMAQAAPTRPIAAAGQDIAAEPTILEEGRPLEIYNTAYGFILRKDYASATRAFGVFLADFPRHDLAGNAQYWLAESYFARGKKAQAAREFLKGYETYPNSPKAPDALLKLGMSLASLGETSQACAAFREYSSKYALEARAFGNQVVREMRNAGC